MTNIASKLAIGGSIVIVLLMMFSAIPVYAEETTNNDSETYDKIQVESGVPNAGIKGIWSWDHEKCTLVLESDFTVKSIHINIKSDDGAPCTIIVKGTVKLNSDGDTGIIKISNSRYDTTITGGGKLIFDKGYIWLVSSGKNENLILDDISIDIKDGFPSTLSTSITSTVGGSSNIIIRNCKSIKLNINNSTDPVIEAAGSFKMQDSNLYLTNTAGKKLIKATDGITLPLTITEKFDFTNPDGSDKWENGTTTEINGISENCSFTMKAYNYSDNMRPIAIGLFITFLVIIAAGTYIVFKK